MASHFRGEVVGEQRPLDGLSLLSRRRSRDELTSAGIFSSRRLRGQSSLFTDRLCRSLYRPVGWSDAVEQFRNLPPLGFGLGTRADLVANILLFIPLTFFWLGATTRGRSNPVRLVGPP